MIFGISVSDIYGCARLAYMLYEEFKQAPGACQEFARDLLHFSNVLRMTTSAIDPETSHLSGSDRDALRLCLDSCKELLWVQIIGGEKAAEEWKNVILNYVDNPLLYFYDYEEYGSASNSGVWLFHNCRQRFQKRKLALRIPKLQRAISSHIEKLNVLLALYAFTIHEVRFAADLPTSQV